MKIGVLADSHDHLPHIQQAVKLLNHARVERVLHAGDYVAPFTASYFGRLEAPLLGTFGNNDGDQVALLTRFGAVGAELRSQWVELELAGRKILMMHEPRGLDVLREAGRYELIIYGHTHQVELQPGKTVVLNPGEVCGWLTGRATLAVVDLGTMEVEIVELSSKAPLAIGL